MELKIVDYEIAKSAKEVGLNWLCRPAYLHDNGEYFPEPELREYEYEQNHNHREHRFSAPTQELLKKFLRDKHKLHIEVNLMQSGFYRVRVIREMGIYDDKKVFGKVDIDTHEEALEAGLKEALKYLLNQK